MRLVGRDAAARLLGGARLAALDFELNAVGGITFFGVPVRDAVEYVSLWVLLSALALVGAAAGIALGAGFKVVLPVLFAMFVLHSRYREAVDGRKRRVLGEPELPSVLDALAAAVRAGMTLEAALRHITRTRKGLVRDLLNEALAAVDAGVDLEEALAAAARKSLCPQFLAVARAVAAARHSSAGLAETLEREAEDIWHEKRALAQERVGKLTTKLVFPVLVGYFIPAAAVMALPLVLSFLRAKDFLH